MLGALKLPDCNTQRSARWLDDWSHWCVLNSWQSTNRGPPCQLLCWKGSHSIRHNVCQSTYIVSRDHTSLFPYVVWLSLSHSPFHQWRLVVYLPGWYTRLSYLAPTMPHHSSFRNAVIFNDPFHAPAPFCRSDCIAQLPVWTRRHCSLAFIFPNHVHKTQMLNVT